MKLILELSNFASAFPWIYFSEQNASLRNLFGIQGPKCTVCKKIVRDQQGTFLWIKTYNLQEHFFQSREIGPCWSRTIFLHTLFSFTGCRPVLEVRI